MDIVKNSQDLSSPFPCTRNDGWLSKYSRKVRGQGRGKKGYPEDWQCHRTLGEGSEIGSVELHGTAVHLGIFEKTVNRSPSNTTRYSDGSG